MGAVADTDAGRSGALGDRLGVPWFDDPQEMFAAGLIDVALICTPPSLHEHHAISALRSGHDVLCEKPFALGLDVAEQMFIEAADQGRLLAMASKFRYVDDLIHAKRLIESGAIGDPVTIEVRFASAVDMSDRWNSVPAISGGGALIDNGTHAVDIVRYLVGDIRRVAAMIRSDAEQAAVEDTGVILGETHTGAIATMSVSWSVAPVGGSYVTVHGSGGAIDVGWQGSRYRSDGDDWRSFGTGYRKLDALRANVDGFAAARAGREPMRNSVADVLASVSVIGAAYRAIDGGSWIDVPDVAAMAGRVSVNDTTGSIVSSA